MLARAKHSGEIQRAQVRTVDKDMVTLHYIDDGFVRCVVKTAIQAILPDECEHEPAGALLIWPELDRPFELQKDLILFYEKLIANQTQLTLVTHQCFMFFQINVGFVFRSMRTIP